MDTDLAFVKEQIGVQERLAAKYADQPHRAGLHIITSNRQRLLFDRLQRLIELETPREQDGSASRVNVSLSDLDGLPEAVMAELSVSDVDRQEMVIEDIIAKNSGVISLDKIIICYFKRSGDILKRNSLISRLFRMAEKGMIFNVPGKRGYYSVNEMSEDDIRKTFGQPSEPVNEGSEDLAANQEPASQEMESNSVPRARMRRRFTTIAG